MSISYRAMLSICLFTLLVPGCTPLLAQVLTYQERELFLKYQTTADSMEWQWNAEEATPEYCAQRVKLDGRYQLEIVYAATGKTVRIRDAKNAVLSEFAVNQHPVFAIADNTLYYTDSTYTTEGCAVDAIDLQTQKTLWRMHLRGGGVRFAGITPPLSNPVTLQVTSGVVEVKGFGSEGQYVEFLDAQTGRTIAHRIFKESRDKMDLSLTLERKEHVAGDALRITATLVNDGDDREIKYSLDQLNTITLYLIEPNGSELMLRHPEKTEAKSSTTLLKSGERMLVLDYALPLLPQPADAWRHCFDYDWDKTLHFSTGKTITDSYSNPKPADLPAPMFPAPGMYHIYLTYSGAKTDPALRSNYASFYIKVLS